MHVPEKQMIFLFVLKFSGFWVSIMLVFGTATSLMEGGGGVTAAGILNEYQVATKMML